MKPPGYWTTLARIPDVDLQRVHRHIISVDTTSRTSQGKNRNAPLLPSEFRQGPVRAGNIDGAFFTEVTDCLWANGLENTLGLEVIEGHAGKMVEFSFDIGSILLKEEEVNEDVTRQFESRETGWNVVVKDGNVDKDGQTRCIVYASGHSKATKLQEGGVIDVLNLLRREGILA
jgi:hypothetical protein